MYTNDIMKHTLLGVALAGILFVGVGSEASAYFTSDQTASVFTTNTTAIFTIDYSFGRSGQEVFLPVLARNTDEKQDSAVSYEIINSMGSKVPGNAVGIIFSNARLTDTGMYATPSGSAKGFKLVVLFTPETPTVGEEYRLHVTHLPFNFGGTMQLKLNDSELEHYITPRVAI